MKAKEVFEVANATAKKVFDKADMLISAGAQAKIKIRFFEKFGDGTPLDEKVKMTAENTYLNAQKEYIKLFADDDDGEAKIDKLVEFYKLTENEVEFSYKICEIFRRHKIPMCEKK